VTLTRLVFAWLPVAAWFLIAARVMPRLVAAFAQPAGQPGVRGGVAIPLPSLKWRIVEAALLTLFASLWFDSLGSGGWWLVFLIVGALATIPTWLRTRADQPTSGALLVGACSDLGRYLVAGAILAWRLG